MPEPTDWSRSVAAQVRSERAAAGLTLDEAAAAAHLRRRMYRRIEAGTKVVDVIQLALIAPVFGLSPGALLVKADARSNDPLLRSLDRSRMNAKSVDMIAAKLAADPYANPYRYDE